jgi:hypothetical protein
MQLSAARDKFSNGRLESHLYFEDILHVSGFTLGILITSFSGGGGGGDSVLKLPPLQGQVEQGTYFRDASQSGFGFPAPFLSGKN